MSAVPPPARRVLDELHAERFVAKDATGNGATAVGRAWLLLDTALDAHTVALAKLDRLEASVVAEHGHPRVALPTPAGATPQYAADAATIDRHVSDRAMARRLQVALRRRQRRLVAAATTAGLPAAQQRETDTASALGDATAALLLAPATTHADLALKLVVLIAAGEAGPPGAIAFPWLHLRRLLTDTVLLSEHPIAQIRSRPL